MNQTIQDDILGHNITVLSFVRNFPVPDKYPAIKETSEIILVELDLRSGDKYINSLSGGNFRMLNTDTDFPAFTTPIVDDDMSPAGYTPLPNSGIRPGKTGTGWIAFTVQTKYNKVLSLRYVRSAATVSGSGESIPAKNIDVPLVK